LEKSAGLKINDAEFAALLYGLKKERTIEINGDSIRCI